MEFKMDMVDKDGNKMNHLIELEVDKNCEDYDAVWNVLKLRMNRASIPIKPVDWDFYDDEGKKYNFKGYLFYADCLEIGMGFVMSIMEDKDIRSKIKVCNYFNGDFYRGDKRKYDGSHVLERNKEYIKKHHPDEVW